MLSGLSLNFYTKKNMIRKIITALTMCIVALSVFGQKNKQQPNVVFIICDDLNDYIGAYGGNAQAITPNIDEFSKLAVTFTNAHVNIPICSPSRNSLFTGVYPLESEDFDWTPNFEHPQLKHNKTIMTLFKENSYHIAGTGKILHEHQTELWDEWGLHPINNYGPFVLKNGEFVASDFVPQPFSDLGYMKGSYGAIDSIQNWVYGYTKRPMYYKNDEDRDLFPDELHARWAVDKLKEYETNNSNQPFFLGVGFVRPHTPLHAPQKYFDMYPLEEIDLSDYIEGDTMDTYYQNYEVSPENLTNSKIKSSILEVAKTNNTEIRNEGFDRFNTLVKSYNGDKELALKKYMQAYLACVTFVDEQIGVVVDAVQNSSFADNTIIILTSDHGFHLGSKNYIFKNSPWEESTRIPLMVSAPNAEKGKRVEQAVSLIDIYPTLVELCNIEGDHKFNNKGKELGGHSLACFLEENGNNGMSWKGPKGVLTIIGILGESSSREDQHISYRTNDWRYILYSDGKEELYNHKTDPAERDNLANNEEYAQIKQQLNSEVMCIIDSENNCPNVTSIDRTERIKSKVYPNPNEGKFTVELDNLGQSSICFSLMNQAGQIACRKETSNRVEHFDISHLSKGLYFLSIHSNKTKNIEKIVIK